MDPKALEGGAAKKEGPMVANAGLVTEIEVLRVTFSPGLYACESGEGGSREGGGMGRERGGGGKKREKEEGKSNFIMI